VTLLLVVLGIVALSIVGGAVTLAVRSKRAYDASNEVVPGVSTRAPAAWAGAHSPEAVLHRRLRAAVLATGAATDARLGDARSVVEREALTIDERLVAAAQLAAPHRDRIIAALEPAVAGIEAAVASMVELPVGSVDQSALDEAVIDVQTRLAALAAARAELDRLDTPGNGP
jgi:hypothetical protein